jgi:hypothetical protein
MYIVLSPELTIYPIMPVIIVKAVWPIFALRFSPRVWNCWQVLYGGRMVYDKIQRCFVKNPRSARIRNLGILYKKSASIATAVSRSLTTAEVEIPLSYFFK